MTPSETHSTLMLTAFARLRAGDQSAKAEIIAYAQTRLRALTSRMLKQFPSVQRWEQTDDVLQTALIRLSRALSDVAPQDQTHFLRLCALQIRRTLVDLARHYQGPEGLGANHQSHVQPQGNAIDDSPVAEAIDGGDPASMEVWTLFHESVATLPDSEREVFELLFYQGLQQTEAAEILGITERTVRRHWTSARLNLSTMLKSGNNTAARVHL